MPFQRWKKLPQEVLNLQSTLEITEKSAPSVIDRISGIGSSAWTLLRGTRSGTLQQLSQSIENGHPDVYRTFSTSGRPQEGETSSIGKIWRGTIEDPELPPVDGGRKAWLFMVGAFMIEGILWGKSFLGFIFASANIYRIPVDDGSVPSILREESTVWKSKFSNRRHVVLGAYPQWFHGTITHPYTAGRVLLMDSIDHTTHHKVSQIPKIPDLGRVVNMHNHIDCKQVRIFLSNSRFCAQ
jgi:hypothetical protein